MEEDEILNKEKAADKKSRLLMQIFKFVIVGGLSFVIDFVIYSVMVYTFKVNLYVSAFFGFTISLIFNYLASMAFVFQRKDDASRTKEFIIFAVLSVIGLGLNELIIWVVVLINDHFVVGQSNVFASMINGINGLIDQMAAWAYSLAHKEYGTTDWVPIEAKVVATAVVMVYNFVTRKIFLEKKDA